MSIILSEEQDVAVDKLVKWFKSALSQQVFKVGGYAGVGKSTVVKYAIKALGLKQSEVAFVTFTGKASLVLTRKGNPAQTIHRFVYDPLISSTRDPITGLKRTAVSGFRLKLEIPDVKLIVIDEVSMVSDDLLRALLSFKIKVLALGDPGQLPPVRGKPNGLLVNPDVFLEHIHRQAADSPIIWASMKARNGETVPYGVHGDRLRVVPLHSLSMEDILLSDQVIACTHKNRKKYNKQVRDYMGFDNPLPELGEKLIAKSNRWDDVSSQTLTPIVNGLQLRVVEPVHRISESLRSFYSTYEADGVPGDFYFEMQTDMDWFTLPPGFEEGDTGSDMLHLDYGYAITCHSSQGSEWGRVTFIEDTFGDPMNRRRLRYTAYTRAAEYLTIVI